MQALQLESQKEKKNGTGEIFEEKMGKYILKLLTDTKPYIWET